MLKAINGFVLIIADAQDTDNIFGTREDSYIYGTVASATETEFQGKDIAGMRVMLSRGKYRPFKHEGADAYLVKATDIEAIL